MRRLFEDVSQLAIRYLEGLDKRNVAPTQESISRLEKLGNNLPLDSTDAEDVLAELDEFVSPATMAMAGPRFFGFVIGGSLPVALAANWLAGAWDQNSAYYDVTPGTALLEELALRWLIEIFKLPLKCGGAFVTGATLANFSALAAARHVTLANLGWDVESDGLIGAPDIKIVVGGEAHPTLFKSLGLLGLGRNKVFKVPVDGQGRMRADALPTLSRSTIVCTQVGNVNTGAFDPIQEICRRAHDAGAWVHVDGAFGLWACAAPSRAYLTSGVADADSWATDAHKWLNVPYDSGLAFVRDAEALRAAMAVTAEYLPTGISHRNPSEYTPELSRRVVESKSGRPYVLWVALE